MTRPILAMSFRPQPAPDQAHYLHIYGGSLHVRTDPGSASLWFFVDDVEPSAPAALRALADALEARVSKPEVTT